MKSIEQLMKFEGKTPIEWDDEGNVTQWKEGRDLSARDSKGRRPISWNTYPNAKVLLWTTADSGGREMVGRDSLTAAQQKRFDENFSKPECIRARQLFHVGRLAREDHSALSLVGRVDNLQSWQCAHAGKADAFGIHRQGFIDKNFFELLSEATRAALADWLLECIVSRDWKRADSLARILKDAHKKPLGSLEFSAHGFAAGKKAQQFVGVVYRCFLILTNFHLMRKLPTKRGLREFVLDEWEELGGEAKTVDTEFSDALRRLGLSGLPQASSKPKHTDGVRKRLEK